MPGRLEFEHVLSSADSGKPYVEWLSNDELLLFSLDKVDQAYNVQRHDTDGKLDIARQIDGTARPRARSMPVSFVGPTGNVSATDTVYVRPCMTMSVNRSRVCWLGLLNDWVVLDINTMTTERRTRGDYADLSQIAFWMPDSQRWCEPVYSRSSKSFAEVDMHTMTSPNPESWKLRGVRRGWSLGTTRSGEWIVLHRSKSSGPSTTGELNVTGLTIVDLNEAELAGRRRQLSIPGGFRFVDVSLAPNSKQLAWLLSRAEQSGVTYNIWITNIWGMETCASKEIVLAHKVEVAVDMAAGTESPYNLEWLPDEASVSLMCNSNLFRCSLS